MKQTLNVHIISAVIDRGLLPDLSPRGPEMLSGWVNV